MLEPDDNPNPSLVVDPPRLTRPRPTAGYFMLGAATPRNQKDTSHCKRRLT